MARPYAVPPARRPVDAVVEIPGSKSITNRALLLAALSDHMVTLDNVLFSDDSRNFLQCLVKLGFPVAFNETNKAVQIIGQNGAIPKRTAAIYVGSAGTAARFLSAMLAAGRGEYLVEASEQMSARPMAPLVGALREQGADFSFPGKPDALPFRIKSNGLQGGRVRLAASQSSQFLSALLMVACFSAADTEIAIEGELPAKPFVAMTLRMMADFGVKASHRDFKSFTVAAGQRYQGLDYAIEPDLSNAGYFFAMAALTGGTVLVRGASLDTLQGDIKLLDILKQMGCKVRPEEDGIRLTGPAGGRFPGVDVDMSGLPDQTPTVAALAPFAASPTIIRNIGFIRYHESDRLTAIVNELTRLGIRAEVNGDGLVIYPGTPQPAELETYDDHRMAMALALVGLRAPGIRIKHPECTAKTFENYFDLFDRTVQGVDSH
ncbi:3-phosphoshikimate 1-carboxyvinyltransferase [Hydrogenispora ethanolica]|uniref:3-phosphoshikimate 1-carboxyvinyltransferase n=1 Tax=Hydrogenispora ethanolica TaxID=1082276 RepID=A0A4R1SBD4_HYDET|nr:3-phosphoshikimate 1-carboxyvinyltransferase [Hydrogenispora ethanolica]TCL76865.1 3-phosphoshikimate 1-carboxyvinyltransferase [Hydrogenispora ethanolica]